MQHDFLGPYKPPPKRHLNWFNRSCTDDRRVSPYFTMGCPFPLKIAPSHAGCRPHQIHGSLVHPSPLSKRHSIASAVFAGLTSVTDQQTNQATRLVIIGRIYVHSTVRAMRPNNNKLIVCTSVSHAHVIRSSQARAKDRKYAILKQSVTYTSN